MSQLMTVQQAASITCQSSYRKIRELGRGGQGIVYLTECQEELSGCQALKVFLQQPYKNEEAYRDDMQRLMKVATLVHGIYHDNLVDVQRFIEYHGLYLMVMQWIEGYDLKRLLDPGLLVELQRLNAAYWSSPDPVVYRRAAAAQLPLQPLLAVNIVEKCFRALSALHDKGIVHGDIKPANIMMDQNGSIRLIDIGSAYLHAAPPVHRAWTPRYVPPEFLESGTWTPQSDLASLGYVLIELLTGMPELLGPSPGDDSTRTSDRGRDQGLLEAKRSLPKRWVDVLPANVRQCERLVKLCSKLIDPEPRRRFPNATAAIDGDADGAWHFRVEIVRGGLGVNEANTMKRWVQDVMKLQGLGAE